MGQKLPDLLLFLLLLSVKVRAGVYFLRFSNQLLTTFVPPKAIFEKTATFLLVCGSYIMYSDLLD